MAPLVSHLKPVGSAQTDVGRYDCNEEIEAWGASLRE